MIHRRNRGPVLAFLTPTLIILLLLVVYPTGRMVYTSLTRYILTRPWEGQTFNFGQNYVRVFYDLRFWLAVIRTGIFTVVSVGMSLLLGFGIASLFNRLDRGRNTFRVLLLAPMVLAPSIAGLIFQFMYNYDFGMINHLLASIGLPRVSFLGTPTLAFFSIIAVDLWQWTPFTTMVLLAGLESLPHELFDAARVDGAAGLRILQHITLPLMKKVIVIVSIFRGIQCIRLYDTVQLMTAGGPGTGTEILNVYITRVGFSWFQMGYASALAFLTLNLGALLATLFIRRTRVFTVNTGCEA